MKFKWLLYSLMAVLFITSCTNEIDTVNPGDKPGQVEITEMPTADFAALESKYGPAVAHTIAAYGVPTVNAPRTRAVSGLPTGISNIYTLTSEIDIPADGSSRIIVAVSSGTFTPFAVRTFDATNQRVLDTGTISAGSMTYDLEIPAYVAGEDEASARVIMFQYENPLTGEFSMINYGVQKAKPVSAFKAWSNISGTIPAEGGSYFVNVSGEFSDYVVFTAMNENNAALGSAPILFDGTSQTSIGLDIWANTSGTPRQVYLYYLTAGGNAPVLFETWTQEAENQGTSESFSLSVNAPEYIPEGGGTYTVTLTPGDYVGTVLVRAYDITTSELLSDYKLLTNTQTTTTITIGANPHGYRRPVIFQYSIPSDDGAYVTFEAVAQNANNSVIETDNFEMITNVPVTIPAAGGSYITTLVGNFKGNLVQLRAYDVDRAMTVSSNIAIITQNNKTAALEITRNSYETPRNILFQYLTDNSGGFITYYSSQQLGTASDNFTLLTNAPATLPYNEASYTVNLINTFTGSAMVIRAIDVNTGEVISDGLSYITNSMKNCNIKIKTSYNLLSRNVAFQYSIDQGTFYNFHTGTQDAYPFDAIVIPGTQLWLSNYNAKSNGMTGNNTMSWAVAMGVNVSYNSNTLGADYVRTEPTGCNGYYEIPDKSDLGLWRLPTREEIAMIKKYAWNSSFKSGLADCYWTSAEKKSTSAYAYGYVIGDGHWGKTHTKYVRCVRDVVK